MVVNIFGVDELLISLTINLEFLTLVLPPPFIVELPLFKGLPEMGGICSCKLLLVLPLLVLIVTLVCRDFVSSWV